MSPSGRIDEQVAVVTGASRGIGAAIARKLASLGAAVVLLGRDKAALDHVASSISGKAEPFPCDVTSFDDVNQMSYHVAQKYGRVDLLVNNAGVGVFGKPLHELEPEEFDRMVTTNLRGPYLTMRAFAPLMIGAQRGQIINISSITSKNPVKGAAAYAATKWALNGLSVSAAEELRDYNIRVSIICPGSTNTDLSPHEGLRTERMLTPDDIAHAVAMLATQSGQSFVSELVIRPTRKP